MLQEFAQNVSSVLEVCCKCFIWMLHIHASCKHMFQVFHTYVAVVSSGCCVYLNGYTCFQVFSGVLQVFQIYVANVSAISNVCCKCFIWMLQSRSGVAHVLMGPTCRIRSPLLLGRRRGSLCGRLRPADASTTCIAHPKAGQVIGTHMAFPRASAAARRSGVV